MSYDPEIHHRRSIRLKGYDYSQAGAYFITICTHDRECIFGEIRDGQMQLNEIGKIVEAEWLKTVEIRDNVELDAFVVMPNHVHGIIIITGNAGTDDAIGANDSQYSVDVTVGADRRSPDDVIWPDVEAQGDAPDDGIRSHVEAHGHAPLQHAPLRRKPKSIGSIVAGFKSTVTKQINTIRNTPGVPVWQRNYYEHIIRNEEACTRIQRYIVENPAQWQYDQENRNDISDEDKKRFWKKYLG
ncbi:MAG: transposase [bacterium]